MDLRGILYWITTFLVVWFLWPLIKWFVIIVVLFFIGLYFYYKHQVKQQEHLWNEGSSNESIYEDARVHDDVIDVEYKKKEINDEE